MRWTGLQGLHRDNAFDGKRCGSDGRHNWMLGTASAISSQAELRFPKHESVNNLRSWSPLPGEDRSKWQSDRIRKRGKRSRNSLRPWSHGRKDWRVRADWKRGSEKIEKGDNPQKQNLRTRWSLSWKRVDHYSRGAQLPSFYEVVIE